MPFKDPTPPTRTCWSASCCRRDAEATRDMAYVFAEEFARLGYTREQLLWLFRNPFYGGAHGAYQALGETKLSPIIDECVNAWGRDLRVPFRTLDSSAISLIRLRDRRTRRRARTATAERSSD